MKILISAFFGFVFCVSLNGQSGFKVEYDKINPVKDEENVKLEDKIRIHQNFLSNAIKEQDQKRIFMGYVFLLSDQMRNQNYVEAQKYLIKADSLADILKNKQWKGHIIQRKAILSMRLGNLEEAIKFYENSLLVCGIAKDNLCVAEGCEQLSTLYGHLQDFVKSDSLYKIALTLLKKHGTEKQLATAYNNRAIILVKKGHVDEAILMYQSAIASFEKLEMTKEKTKAMNNLADGYRNLGKHQKALEILKTCIEINKVKNYTENLKVNYANISAVYDSLKQYQLSLEYIIKHHALKDSLVGVETQAKILDINANHEIQKQDMKLLEKELLLHNRVLQNRIKNILLISALILFIILTFIFYTRMIKNKLGLKIFAKKVNELTQNDVEKSTIIHELENTISSFKTMIYNESKKGQTEEDTQIFQTILTNEDWFTFKSYFEQNHVGYIKRLRNKFPSLTESEERLFLLLKLNLNSKEIAAILGIAIASVKKTRSRLRKKLDLTNEKNLNIFISEF
ncbi:MAG: tetratricopeptide repeat protein [Saprospiraceae bacterium]